VGSHVTVVEMLDHIAGNTDREIGKILQNNYKKKGVEFMLGCKVTSVGDGKVTFEDAEGKTQSVDADKVLCSIGRRAVTQGFGLENINVYTERGATGSTCWMQFTLPNVTSPEVGEIHNDTYYSELEIGKEVFCVLKDGMEEDKKPTPVDNGDIFQFEVVFTSPEGKEIDPINDLIKYKIYTGDSKIPDVESVLIRGEGVVLLKHNQRAVFENLRVGWEYTITEQSARKDVSGGPAASDYTYETNIWRGKQENWNGRDRNNFDRVGSEDIVPWQEGDQYTKIVTGDVLEKQTVCV